MTGKAQHGNTEHGKAWQGTAEPGAPGKSNSHSGPKTNLTRAPSFSNPYVCLSYKLNTFHTLKH